MFVSSHVPANNAYLHTGQVLPDNKTGLVCGANGYQ